jgi:hypothetical protein
MSLVTVSTAAMPPASPSSGTGSAAKSATAAGAAAATASTDASKPAPIPTPPIAPPPSATVTLSPQAQALMTSPAAAPAETSTYDALKNRLTHGVEDVADAIVDGAKWVGHGIADVASGVDTLVHGVAELPFAIGAKLCDAAGAVLDAI